MLTKRIIPCLDVLNGAVVKGVHFRGLKRTGSPNQLAKLYAEQGADEIVFLDVGASPGRRKLMCDVVTKTASKIKAKKPVAKKPATKKMVTKKPTPTKIKFYPRLD